MTISIALAGAVGAAIGVVALGAAALHGDIPGLSVALRHIPMDTHAYAVVTAVKSALMGGAAGGGIGVAVSAAAKGAHAVAAH